MTERNEHARLAAAVVLAACEAVYAAGMSRDDFAAYLSAALGEDIAAETLEYWEIGAVPPGDVLLLGAAVVRETIGAVPGYRLPAHVRAAAERLSRDMPPFPQDDPVCELLHRRS
jgi:hypothetical protein